VKATETVGPVLIHVVTEKGRGFIPAETASDRMHGVGKFDIRTGKQEKGKSKVRGRCSCRAPHLPWQRRSWRALWEVALLQPRCSQACTVSRGALTRFPILLPLKSAVLYEHTEQLTPRYPSWEQQIKMGVNPKPYPLKLVSTASHVARTLPCA
jgi:hypothetical protein